MYFEADPYTGFRLKARSAGRYQEGIPAVTNSYGHRDAEVAVHKTPGVFRILVIGDSFTVGANVRQEQAYPKVLERLLRSTYGPRIEVINSGVGGWEPFQYAQYFEYYGRHFEPDLVLVGFFVGNDTFDATTHSDQLGTAILGQRVSRDAASRPFISLQVFLYEHSNLARLLLSRGPIAQIVKRTHCADFSKEFIAVQQARMLNHLRYSEEQRGKAQNAVDQIRRIKDRSRVPTIVVLIPDENQTNPALQRRIINSADLVNYDFKMPQSMLTEMFSALGISTIDLLSHIVNDSRCLYMNDTHWTPEGHELAASVILEGLKTLFARSGAL